jgi:hypothetical protein
MTQQDRPQLDYATPASRQRAFQSNSVAVATIVSGTALLLAPWICLGLGDASLSSLIRAMHGWPFFWITEAMGFAMILTAYLRASPFEPK